MKSQNVTRDLQTRTLFLWHGRKRGFEAVIERIRRAVQVVKVEKIAIGKIRRRSRRSRPYYPTIDWEFKISIRALDLQIVSFFLVSLA